MAANKGQLVLMGCIAVGAIVFAVQPWTLFSKPAEEGADAAVEATVEAPTEVTPEPEAPTETESEATEAPEEERDPDASPTPTLPPANLYNINANDYYTQ